MASARKALSHKPPMRQPSSSGKTKSLFAHDMRSIAARAGAKKPFVDPFRPAVHPPEATPPKGKGLAMDEQAFFGANRSLGWAGGIAAAAWTEGQQFLGYPYLAELAQRPEYRVISEIIAEEATRKWIKLKVAGDGESANEGKLKRIAEINDALDKFKIRDLVRTVSVQDGLFGRGHVYIDTDASADEDLMPLGDGRDAISQAKVKKGSIKRFTPIEAVWCYPTNYNATDPKKPNWYKPDQWFVMSAPCHASRLLTIIGQPVPDLLKPAYSFGGLSRSQLVKPYVDNWLNTRQSVADIIQAFSVFVLSTDLGSLLGLDGQKLFDRADMFNNLRRNSGLMMLDKATEEFKNVAASLAGLDALQAQTQEHMAAVSRIPLVKLLGIQPAGLNASSEGEIKTFYDTILAYQQSVIRDLLTKIIDFIQLTEFGEVDEDIIFEFEPLESINEKELAEVEKIEAETDQIHVDTGVISPEEVRARIIANPDSPYSNLNPNDVPDLLEEEQEGLVPKGGGSVTAELSDEDEGNDEPAPKAKKKVAQDSALALRGEIELALDLPTTPNRNLRTRLNALLPRAEAAGFAQDAHDLKMKLAGYYSAVAKECKKNGELNKAKLARQKAQALSASHQH